MKNESLMGSKATPPISRWPVEAGEVGVESTFAEPQHSSSVATKAETRSESGPTGLLAAWFHAPFIP